MVKGEQSTLEIEHIRSEEIDYHAFLPEYKIFSYPTDFTLEILNNKVISNEIEVEAFQRKYVWKSYQASRLVESFLAGLPVPPIFLYLDANTQSLKIIDGLQRLRTIQYFIRGNFEELKGKQQIFKLKELHPESKWYNKTFQDLREEDKRKFLNAVLRAIIVIQVNPGDDSSIYHIFERLNTGGTLLTNQEIRNSISHGTLNDKLKALNKNENWRLIIGKPNEDNRQNDVELILRVISLYYWANRYEKPLKNFMNLFMSKYRNPGDECLNEIEYIFTLTCEKVHSTLGKKPFNIKRGINLPVLDSVMVSFARNLDRIPDDVRLNIDG